MSISTFLPPEVVLWLMRYGIFVVLVGFAALLLLVLFRPFWLWFTGQSEVLDRLKALDRSSKAALLELEMLNKTLSIPLKRQSAKGKPVEESPVEAYQVTEFERTKLLEALAKSRKEKE